MTELGRRWREATQTEREGRIPVLDGARVLFVFLVGAYHIWQQSWLTPSFTVGETFISLDPLLRSGYIWVDAMLLLSGFLLYLPWTRLGADKPAPAIGAFYRRRFLRIAPSYYLCVLVVLFVVALPQGSYRDGEGVFQVWYLARDLLAHATFTHTLFPFSYTGSPLNGVLWTLGVEVQFYVLFPFIARLFRKKPLLVYLGMNCVAFGYRAWVHTLPDTTLFFNQLPAMLDVYANGMAAACIYAAIKKQVKGDGDPWLRVLATVVMGVAMYTIWRVVCDQAGTNGYDHIREGQMDRRWLFSVLIALFMLGACFSLRGVRFVLGNRVTAFFSAVSYQFYMWHQVLSVQLKKWNIPIAQTDQPWMYGERSWQIPYVLLCFGIALGLSALITYLFERPIAQKKA